MGVVTFEYGTLFHGRQNYQGTFDADIDESVRNQTTNADLTLYLRINFVKVDPTSSSATYKDYNGTDVPIRKWKADEWATWKSRFLRDCRSKWHGKFWLATPRTFIGFDWPKAKPTHRCNLYCRFDITEQSNKDGAHAVIPVVRVNGSHSFRSHMLLYDNGDLKPLQLTAGSKFFTHVHEIGHLIGLNHPGTGLTGCATGGETACYAGADGTDTGIMGRGSKMETGYAKPWQKAAAILTGTKEADWAVSLTRVYPKKI